ncbi:ubiquitin-protein ligase E3 A [Nematocida sp. LUAm3]|nr:ubiquitin-protein ligase E3 A [Nematocida sp. LUAm3]KAI5173613.1 ubiquitin-protein ligase E3 A [Nematocida sp. LUAm2]KAI5176834.1 ubiquitin-protein ligase E3 A [Nematocida sp. LUAm1]
MEKNQLDEKTSMALIDRLRKQLLEGCGERACVGLFCKISDIHEYIDEVSHLLMGYGGYFICSSIYLIHGRHLSRLEIKRRRFKQAVLYPNRSVGSFISHPGEENNQPKEEANVSQRVLEYLFQDLEGDETISTPQMAGNHTEENQRKIEAMNMDLARILHRQNNRATSIMLQAVFYNEINKSKVMASHASAVKIIRIFNGVKAHVKFDKKYFIGFLHVLQDMCSGGDPYVLICRNQCNRVPGGLDYNKVPECGYSESEEFPFSDKPMSIRHIAQRNIETCILCKGSFSECELPQCDHLCLLSKKLCVNELVDLVKSLIIVIDNTNATNIRESALLPPLLTSLKMLYEFSVKTGLVHHSVFINKKLSRELNYKVELKYHKEGEPSILDYPFILDVPAKYDLLYVESADRMKAELQDAFFRSMFEGKIAPYLDFTVGRNSLVDDISMILQKLQKNMVWKQLKIKFLGEDGVDSGGIKKEFFQIIGTRLLESWDIFEERNNLHWIKSYSKEETKKLSNQYYMLGCILGLALYNGASLCFYFPLVFYKKILKHPTTFSDLKQLDPGLYDMLCKTDKMSAEEIDALGLVLPGETEDIPVTANNIKQFITAYQKELLEYSVEDAFSAIREGFWSICNGTFVSSLLPCELSTLIGGIELENLEDIEKYIVYNGYKRDSFIVKSFWEIFKAYDKLMQKRFLLFVTGSDRAPSGGPNRMPIVFMKNGGDTDRLPSAQTCFNTFLVPEYSSKEKFQEKLDFAIKHTEGFFLL